MERYFAILPLGAVHKWDNKEGLFAWLDSIIYHSFLLGNEQGIPTHLSILVKVPLGSARISQSAIISSLALVLIRPIV